MKKIIYAFLCTFYSLNLSSQTFKEILSFHENGEPKEVTYKNDDLKIVKTQEFDPDGNHISEYNFDPSTGKRDGEFFNSGNKGFYKKGLLNCKNCSIVFDEYSDTNFKGDFTNGRPSGKITVYQVTQDQDLRYDQNTSYLLSMEYGERVNYSRYVNTGSYTIKEMMVLFYNEKGNLDGSFQINERTKLFFTNGVLDGFIIKNKENQSVTKDSVFRENKIWKVENSFIKNTGWLKELKWDDMSYPWEFEYEYYNHPKRNTTYRIGRNKEDAVSMYFFGSSNSTPLEPEYPRYQSKFNIGFEVFETKNILENGIYSKRDNSSVLLGDEIDQKIKGEYYKTIYYQIIRSGVMKMTDIFSDFNFLGGHSHEYSVMESVLRKITKTANYVVINLTDFIEFIEYTVLKHSHINRIWIRDGEKYRDIEDVFKELKLREEYLESKEEQNRIKKNQINKDNLLSFLIKNHLQCPDEISQTNNYESISSYLKIEPLEIENKISEIKDWFFGDNTSTKSNNFSLQKGELFKRTGYNRDGKYDGVVFRLDLIKHPKWGRKKKWKKWRWKPIFKKYSFIRIEYIFEHGEFNVRLLEPTSDCVIKSRLLEEDYYYDTYEESGGAWDCPEDSY